MSAIVPPPKAPPPLIFKILVGILFTCTLVALWVAGARVKAAKIAARHGEKIESTAPPPERPRLRVPPEGGPNLDDFFAKAPASETADVELDPASPPKRQEEVARAAAARGIDFRYRVGDSGPARLVLRRRERLRIEHVSLTFLDGGGLLVEDSRRRALVEFSGIQKGQIRRWQEIQVTVAEASPESLSIEVELKPGAPSFGAGRYRARQGLQVLFDGGRSVTINAWDPVQGGMTVRCEGPGQPVERILQPDQELRLFALLLRMHRDGDGEGTLLIGDLE